MSLKLTDIITEFGKYYLNNGQNRSRLIRGLVQPTETLNIPGIRHIRTDETIYQLANPIFNELLQGFQKDFTAKGETDFHPNTIQLRHCKIDHALYPHDIEETWLGFMDGDSSRTIEQWPIVRYIMEEYFTNQVLEDKENEVIYKGVYAEPTTGTASDANTVFDGLHIQMLRGALDTKYPINIIHGVGQMDETDALNQIEYFCDKIDHKAANKRLVIFVAPEILRAYLRLKRNAGWYQITNDSQVGVKVDFTNFTLVGVASMIGTTDIFATLAENILHLTKRDFNTANIDVQKEDRKVKFLADWFEAVGFGCNQLIWATKETVDDSFVATPTATLDGTTLKLATSTSGATIKYTTDGTEPSATNGSTGTSVSNVTAGTTVKAIAIKSGLLTSEVMTFTAPAE